MRSRSWRFIIGRPMRNHKSSPMVAYPPAASIQYKRPGNRSLRPNSSRSMGSAANMVQYLGREWWLVAAASSRRRVRTRRLEAAATGHHSPFFLDPRRVTVDRRCRHAPLLAGLVTAAGVGLALLDDVQEIVFQRRRRVAD